MLDGLKILVQNVNPEWLKENYQFKTDFVPITGETSTKYILNHNFCTTKITPNNNVLFIGSVHKYYNNIFNEERDSRLALKNPKYRGFNADRFKYSQVMTTIDLLKSFYRCEAKDLVLQNLEFGLNIKLDFNPQLFLKGLLYHKGSVFDVKYDGRYYQCVHNDYILKIYNKGKQYRLYNNLMRVEVRYKRSRCIKKFGIKNLGDISPKSLRLLFDDLIKKLDEVIYYDYTIHIDKFSKSKQNKLNCYKDKNYWKELDKSERYRQKEYFKKIIDDQSENLLFNIKKLLAEELENCLPIPQYYIQPKIEKLLPIPPFNIKGEGSRICTLTGLDISMQKTNSSLLSHTGLNYYFNNDKKVFELIKNKYLSTKWQSAEHKKQIIEIAHNIRNSISNSRIKQSKLYPKNQPLLFSI